MTIFIIFEVENKEGIMIILNFAKPFDTLEWLFVERCLESFSFGNTSNLTSIVKLF